MSPADPVYLIAAGVWLLQLSTALVLAAWARAVSTRRGGRWWARARTLPWAGAGLGSLGTGLFLYWMVTSLEGPFSGPLEGRQAAIDARIAQAMAALVAGLALWGLGCAVSLVVSLVGSLGGGRPAGARRGELE